MAAHDRLKEAGQTRVTTVVGDTGVVWNAEGAGYGHAPAMAIFDISNSQHFSR